MATKEYTARTVIAGQRRVLAMAATVIRHTFPVGRRDMLHAFDGTLLTVKEVLEHVDCARKLKVRKESR